MVDMEVLIRKRNILKATLNDIEQRYSIIPADSALDVDELELNIEHLDEVKSKFEVAQTKIEELCDDENIQAQTAERGKFESQYIKTKAKLKGLFRKLIANSFPSPDPFSSNNSQRNQQQVQLPKINLPTYDGNYTDWPAFYDLFTALVDSKTNITDVQKLQYLKSSLKGDALRKIQSLSTIEANYKTALDTLKAKYDNNRIIVNAHVKELFQSQGCTTESATGLRKIINSTQENLSALKMLKEPVEHWSTLLVHMITEKLDPETRKQWELSLSSNEVPKYDDLIKFLETRCRALEITSSIKQRSSSSSNAAFKTNHSSSTKKTNSSHSFVASETSCILCSNVHQLYRCDKFHKMTVSQRYEVLKKHNRCFNCLNSGHSSEHCKSGSCKVCHRKHHSLLHTEQVHSSGQSKIGTGLVEETQQTHFSNNSKFKVLLSTVVIAVLGADGKRHSCRCLLDNGSQANFVTKQLSNKLGLKRENYKIPIQGIGAENSTSSSGIVKLSISSLNSDFTMTINAAVLTTISGNIPSSHLDSSGWTHIKNLKLADPSFMTPQPIDILLGAEVFARVFIGDRLISDCGPAAMNTELGWILSGRCESSSNVVSSFLAISIDDQIKKFWELEELPHIPILSPEEQACETHFKGTTYRDSTGRYYASLPLKDSFGDLGESRQRAVQQQLNIERQLAKNESKRDQYVQFMREYLTLGHMEEVPPDQQTESNHSLYYIPHHAVLKSDSTTTKLRVVFNASAATSLNTSLNEQLMVGPTLQAQLVELILRFRLHRIALVADIEKMYRQIWIRPEHQDLQRIVWRFSLTEPLQDYRLKTVTYGTGSASYTAVRTLMQLAEDEKDNFPLGAAAVQRDFYVDDLISGTDTIEEATVLQEQLIQLLSSGGFHLRKWSSNSPEVLDHLPNEDRELSNATVNLDCSRDSIKTLGICWKPTTDQFSINICSPNSNKPTKRTILSDVSRIFDPLGWLSPVVLIGKSLIQRLWVAGVDWDADVPDEICTLWKEFSDQLKLLQSLFIDRYVHSSPDCIHELHGFSDASELAYGAVVYLKVQHPSGDTHVSLLASKTRVAPVRQVSLPRLELCGAVILARLLKFISTTLDLPNLTIFAWTDSMIVLNWLAELPRTWRTFVANRISEIQESVPSNCWRHVRSVENPADHCSRGLMPSELIDNDLWWKGPSWLQNPESSWPPTVRVQDPHINSERRGPISCHVATQVDLSMLEGCSSLTRLIRVTAYCLRFASNTRKPAQDRKLGFLTTSELNEALNSWVRRVQQVEFSPEINHLSQEKSIPSSSHLLSLHPFLDSSGILRVGGRLVNASIPYDQKHPIILPSANHLTKLIITHEHQRHLHAGPTLLLTVLHRRYWILRSKAVVKKILFQCVRCFRERAQASSQLMGNLPSHRVEPARPFLRCGTDYAGPVMLRTHSGRGKQPQVKAYIVVFVCFAVKAIHLELATDLTSACFLAAFHRFTARHGKPAHVYSDCGTNYVGAQANLQPALQQVSSRSFNEDVDRALTKDNIQWHFNPPASPHFGGLWEAGVRSTKQHLRRVIGDTLLTYEEMSTLLCQIEACLNSRPLCPMSPDPDNLDALTPGHFLIGEAPTYLPDPDLTEVSMNRLTRWELVQRMKQLFWNRWSGEYLHRLQQRPKWKNSDPNIKVNELVLIKEEKINPLKWPLARVEEVHPGNDGLVRVVTVKTKNGLFKRPIAKLCKLPLD